MENKKISFSISEKTCSIVLSVLSFMFIFGAFITSLFTVLFNVKTSGGGEEAIIYKLSIEWKYAGLYFAFMIVGFILLFIKTVVCTRGLLKVDKGNGAVTAALVLEIISLLLILLAAFAIFMHAKELKEQEYFDRAYRSPTFPVLVCGSLSSACVFFSSVLNIFNSVKD